MNVRSLDDKHTGVNSVEDFLKVEYEQCLALMKFYDERQMSLMKYTTGLSSSVISIIFAFHKLNSTSIQADWGFIFLISSITSLGLIALFVAMVQNRLYFIYPARQVNAIRKSMLENVNVKEVFQNNQMYLTTNINDSPAKRGIFFLHFPL